MAVTNKQIKNYGERRKRKCVSVCVVVSVSGECVGVCVCVCGRGGSRRVEKQLERKYWSNIFAAKFENFRSPLKVEEIFNSFFGLQMIMEAWFITKDLPT